MTTKLVIDEREKVVWLLTEDDPPYFTSQGSNAWAIYSANTGKFLGVKLKLIDPELEVFRVKAES